MTIEHRAIEVGDLHPVANWVIPSGGMAVLNSLDVTEADIGKQAWVTGQGHYVLAAVSPNVWESASPTVSSVTYTEAAHQLMLTMSDEDTLTVKIPAGAAKVDNMAALLLLVGVVGTLTVANTLGFYSAGDGGSSYYRWDAASAAAHDGVFVVKPTSLVGAGRWIYMFDGTINVLQCGIKNDGATDNSAAFAVLAAYVAGLTKLTLVFPAGVYLNSTHFRVSSTTITHCSIQAEGAEYVVTAPTPLVGAYFSIYNTAFTGKYMHVAGLKLRMNRATVRTGNCDMIGFKGFANYIIANIHIPSADNMGLVIGRNDGSFVPDSLHIICPVIGGRFTAGDSHAPIGDTGIWMNCAAKVTHITSPQINGTGDDAILIGHVQNAGSGGAYITNMDLRNVSNGVSISCPRGVITGRITRTNNTGVQLHRLDNGQAADIHVQVDLQEIGYMQAGEIGTSIISKVLPHGVFIYLGATTHSNINLDGTRVHKCLESAVVLQPQNTGAGAGLIGVYGTVQCSLIGQTEAGTAVGGAACLSRKSTGGNAFVKDVNLTIVAHDCKVPLVAWLPSGETNDSDIFIHCIAYNVKVDALYTSTYLLNVEPVGGRAGRLVRATFKLDLTECTFGTMFRIPTATAAERRDILLYGTIEGAAFNFSNRRFFVGNSNSASRRPLSTFSCTRLVGAGTILAELDPAKTWKIEAEHIYGGAAMGATGAKYSAVWSPNTSSLPDSLATSTLNIINDVVGSNSTGYEVVYNAASTAFAHGSVEIKGKPTGFGLGFINTLLIATCVESGITATYS